MQVFDLLRLLMPELAAGQAKLHLAGWNGKQDPLDVYLAGKFNAWQSWQSRRNFERDYVISLIALTGTDRWLFAGAYRSLNYAFVESRQRYLYELEPVAECAELSGRLVVRFARPGRQSYLNAESWVSDMTLAEFLPEPLSIGEFPGFKALSLTWLELELVVRQAVDSWRAALSSVSGVYLISDSLTGKLYVGAASGEGGIWQRWSNYAANGHGNNKELAALIKEEGAERAEHFSYAVLEIADLHASEKEIFARESHWKSLLLSRIHGMNRN